MEYIAESVSASCTYAASWLYKKPKPKQALDPFCTVVRLALMGYLPIGSKMGVKNNGVECIQTPYTLVQGAKRRALGYAAADMTNFGMAIECAAVTYRPDLDARIRKVFEWAMVGLCRLQETYKEIDPMAHLMLESFKKTCLSALDPQTIEGRWLYENDAIQFNAHIFEDEKVWTKAQRERILDWMDEMDCSAGQPEQSGCVWAIQEYCVGKDKRMSNFDFTRLRPQPPMGAVVPTPPPETEELTKERETEADDPEPGVDPACSPVSRTVSDPLASAYEVEMDPPNLPRNTSEDIDSLVNEDTPSRAGHRGRSTSALSVQSYGSLNDESDSESEIDNH